ncbi:segregation and condensation protein A [Legionella moravica]|uniref:Segregation and condensation protein A n=1 Tax=Legionella moravica TaxID=39962 RepID=A0A378JZF6_9GAMM|nr:MULTISPECIES: ScpA family protein [Legionella]KTD34262.1 segregation and condensation protein A [Legionella moravica]RUR19670.1 segregation/condensation protein A [Legionella sp. km535]STX62862.1 segregation and condensation protein A [Legionella moravica]
MNVELSNKPEIRAIVDGVELTQVPDDLFIPPDALEVLLDSFSGPLDLLLYLIRKQNIDILDIPMVSITRQYLQYIQLMECRRLELAADYLLMAAMLAEIKSRLLLPVTPNSEDGEEEDPRMTLVRKLQAYEQIKEAAQLLDALPRKDRDNFIIQITPDEIETIKVHPDVELSDLIEAMKGLLLREEQMTHHQIAREAMSVRERMSLVLLKLQEHKVLEFTQLFLPEEGRMGLVVSLLAILELARQSLIVITQNQPFSPIHLQAA